MRTRIFVNALSGVGARSERCSVERGVVPGSHSLDYASAPVAYEHRSGCARGIMIESGQMTVFQRAFKSGEVRSYLLPALFLVIGVATPAIFRNSNLVLKGEDSFEYVTGGKSIAQGLGYLGMNGKTQVLFPPGFPLTIAAGATFYDPVKVARTVSWLSSGLSVVLLFLIARRWFGTMIAAISALFFAFLPVRVWLAQEALSESLYLMLLLLSVWLAVRIESKRVLPLFALGLVVGYAYITRPEALILIAILAAVILMKSVGSRREAKCLVAYALGLVVVVLPYVLWLSFQVGHFAITGKGNGEVAHGMARVQGRQDVEIRSLNQDDSRVTVRGSSPGFQNLIRHFAGNLEQLKNSILLNTGVQPIAGGLLFLGLIEVFRKVFQERLWQLGLLQLLFVLQLVLYTPFWIEQRFLLSGSPALCAWMAIGAIALLEWMRRGWKDSTRSTTFAVVVVIILALANVGSFAWKLHSTNIADDKTHASQEMAQILRQFPGQSGEAVIGDYPGVAYFAGIHHEWMPTCDLSDLRRFAALNHAHLVAFSEADAPTPATQKLLAGNFAPGE